MYKYLFKNDYSELAHAEVLAALAAVGEQQLAGYGEDVISLETQEILRDLLKQPAADVHFITSGTLANLIGLSWMMTPAGAVLAADTGHINVHEAGALEATGHKILGVANPEGKVDVEKMEALVKLHEHEHMVTPEVIYLSQPTELGTVYTRTEFEAVSEFCRRHGLYLYVDGARMGTAITSQGNDLELPTLAALADMLYIGGTKNGVLFGEALVVTNSRFQKNFRGAIKQRGGLLAKSYSISAQFKALFQDNLYFQLAAHANAMAQRLVEGIEKLGYGFHSPTQTNQVFPIIPRSVIEQLETMYGFYIWVEPDGGDPAIRLVTSWATPASAIDVFLSDLASITRE
ncbi:MAG: aminotransferase class I/II-fold pyridoxal phosphate-dependent enzyme [Pseudomonadota bacterium]